MTISTEELRSVLLVYLREGPKNNPNDRLTFASACKDAARELATRAGKEAEWHRQGCRALDGDDAHLLKQVVWDLILGRVLIPGSDNPNDGWPIFSLTEHGKKVVGEVKPGPYDADGYLKPLRDESPNLHSTVFRYVEEAIETFRSGNHLASVVMLGAASERLFDDIAESIAGAIVPSQQAAFEAKINKTSIAPRIAAVIK